MNLAQLLHINGVLFFLIFARWASMIMLAPVFGSRQVPNLIKVGWVMALTVVMYTLLQKNTVLPPEVLTNEWVFIALLIREIVLGLIIGFIAYLLMAIVEMGARLIDIQMGFAMGSSINPVYDTQSTVVSNFQMLFTVMILLATNSHHYLIAAMVRSYAFFPINGFNVPLNLEFVIFLMGQFFMLGLQISLPVMGGLFLADIGLGILSKTVPQLNIFSVIFPMKIIFGLIILVLTSGYWDIVIEHLQIINLDWITQLFMGTKNA